MPWRTASALPRLLCIAWTVTRPRSLANWASTAPVLSVEPSSTITVSTYHDSVKDRMSSARRRSASL
ncbi:MAG: hypothetical protein ABI862_03205 [Ilumatobacteraceae bacterium]